MSFHNVRFKLHIRIDDFENVGYRIDWTSTNKSVAAGRADIETDGVAD